MLTELLQCKHGEDGLVDTGVWENRTGVSERRGGLCGVRPGSREEEEPVWGHETEDVEGMRAGRDLPSSGRSSLLYIPMTLTT